jgi:hypothetical protein
MRCAYSFICLAIALHVTAAVAECLKANVEGQNVQGQLTVGHARDAAGRPEKPYILRLTSNVCLDADDPDEAVKNTRTIHVFTAEARLEPAFRRLVGRKVVIRGNPFPAHTAHHHAPIVMQVSEIHGFR